MNKRKRGRKILYIILILLLVFAVYRLVTRRDMAARELIGEIDEEGIAYNLSESRLTPGGNYRNMCKRLGGTWGFRHLGEDTVKEIILNYLI